MNEMVLALLAAGSLALSIVIGLLLPIKKPDENLGPVIDPRMDD